jgi:hypothetical protein
MLTAEKPEPKEVEKEMATDISTDLEQSGTSEESEPRLTSEECAPNEEEMREIKCSSIQRCLDIMGEYFDILTFNFCRIKFLFQVFHDFFEVFLFS